MNVQVNWLRSLSEDPGDFELSKFEESSSERSGGGIAASLELKFVRNIEDDGKI